MNFLQRQRYLRALIEQNQTVEVAYLTYYTNVALPGLGSDVNHTPAVILGIIPPGQ
jgi:hypothetical protein